MAGDTHELTEDRCKTEYDDAHGHAYELPVPVGKSADTGTRGLCLCGLNQNNQETAWIDLKIFKRIRRFSFLEKTLRQGGKHEIYIGRVV